MCGMSNLKCYLSVRGITTKIFNTKCDCNIKVLNIIEFWIPRYYHPTIKKANFLFCPIEISQIIHLIGFFVHWSDFVTFRQCKNYWILNHFCDWQYNNNNKVYKGIWILWFKNIYTMLQYLLNGITYTSVHTC